MRLATTFIVLLLASLATAMPAAAAPTSIQMLTPTGESDPVEDLPRLVRFTGTAANAGDALLVTVGQEGRPGCSSSYAADIAAGLGTKWKEYGRTNMLPDYSTTGYHGIALQAGDYSFDQEVTFPEPGVLVFCAWEARSTGAITTPSRFELNLRMPVASLEISMEGVTDGVVRPGASVTFSARGTAEAARKVYASFNQGSLTCPKTPAANTAKPAWWNIAPGRFDVRTVAWTEDEPATVTVCAYVAESTGDVLPVATATMTYRVEVAPATPVVTPQPPAKPRACVVPRLRGLTVARARARLASASCGSARVVRITTRAVPRGRVARQSRAVGARLAVGTRITVYVRR